MWATISAAMETAVSSGGAGAEVEADRGVRAGQVLLRYAGLPRQVQTLDVGAARAHRADVAHGQPSARPQQRDVGLRVVREDADGGTGVHLGSGR